MGNKITRGVLATVGYTLPDKFKTISVALLILSIIIQSIFIPCNCEIGAVLTNVALCVNIAILGIILVFIFKKRPKAIFYLSLIFLFFSISISIVKWELHQ